MKPIQTSEIKGPPFMCPECAAAGKRTGFDKRPPLGTHRLLHGIAGTSTGSKAYKKAHAYKNAHKQFAHATRFKKHAGGRPRKVEVSPIMEMLSHPDRFASELESVINAKQFEVDQLQDQIRELNESIAFYKRFRAVAAEPSAIQEVA